MTENEARQVLLLQAVESAAPSPAWSLEDRRWATRQAVATVGEQASPDRFAVARAVVALQRLLPRDAPSRRWLERRGWHPAWVLLAALLGLAAGLVVDQLGPPQRVNLLAPAVWAVVAWNLAVYGALLLPWPKVGPRALLARLGLRGDAGAGALWARHASGLMSDRAALVLHVAAAALAAGLVAGLYLRGLVLDYRAGWQSTFADAATVQRALDITLAPAAALTGIAVPDVAPLRVGPGADATASAAPWIHLYAATLALAVLLPRGLLALRAGWRARHAARHFPLPLDTAYFEALHPLMRPGLPRALRLLWASSLPGVRLLGHDLDGLDGPLMLWRSDEGDELQLLPVPGSLSALATSGPATGSWWSRWRDPTPRAVDRLHDEVDAVLWAATAAEPPPPWLQPLGRPVLRLVDGAAAGAEGLSLQALADGWLPDGRLWPALQELLADDPRLPRLAQAWAAQQGQRLDAMLGEVAHTLATAAAWREPLARGGVLPDRRLADEALQQARQALLARLDAAWRAHDERLAEVLGGAAAAVDVAAVPLQGALHSRVGEGRAAVMGGVLSGALAGLKADVLSGGLTMGAGALAGGVIGALGAAGAARGLNVVRGTETGYLDFDDGALATLAEALLVRGVARCCGLAPARVAEALAPGLRQGRPLAALDGARGRPGEAGAVAEALRPALGRLVRQGLGGPQA